jgi:polyferredoxin
MKRQSVRKALILVSLLLFPLTLYYFSPVLVIIGAFQGLVVGSLLTFALLFLASLVVGRAYCGWLCPAAGLQEALFTVQNKRAGRHRWVKYVIWVPWLAGIAAGFWAAGGARAVQPFYELTGGISVAEPAAYIIYYAFVGLIVILALTAGRRAFCHYVCWMAPFMVVGAKLRDAFGWPALRLAATPGRCTRCGRCTKTCPMSLDVQRLVEQGQLNEADCILCGECVDGCPKRAISFAFGPWFPSRSHGTPRLP